MTERNSLFSGIARPTGNGNINRTGPTQTANSALSLLLGGVQAISTDLAANANQRRALEQQNNAAQNQLNNSLALSARNFADEIELLDIQNQNATGATRLKYQLDREVKIEDRGYNLLDGIRETQRGLGASEVEDNGLLGEAAREIAGVLSLPDGADKAAALLAVEGKYSEVFSKYDTAFSAIGTDQANAQQSILDDNVEISRLNLEQLNLAFESETAARIAQADSITSTVGILANLDVETKRQSVQSLRRQNRIDAATEETVIDALNSGNQITIQTAESAIAAAIAGNEAQVSTIGRLLESQAKGAELGVELQQINVGFESDATVQANRKSLLQSQTDLAKDEALVSAQTTDEKIAQAEALLEITQNDASFSTETLESKTELQKVINNYQTAFNAAFDENGVADKAALAALAEYDGVIDYHVRQVKAATEAAEAGADVAQDQAFVSANTRENLVTLSDQAVAAGEATNTLLNIDVQKGEALLDTDIEAAKTSLSVLKEQLTGLQQSNAFTEFTQPLAIEMQNAISELERDIAIAERNSGIIDQEIKARMSSNRRIIQTTDAAIKADIASADASAATSATTQAQQEALLPEAGATATAQQEAARTEAEVYTEFAQSNASAQNTINSVNARVTQALEDTEIEAAKQNLALLNEQVSQAELRTQFTQGTQQAIQAATIASANMEAMLAEIELELGENGTLSATRFAQLQSEISTYNRIINTAKDLTDRDIAQAQADTSAAQNETTFQQNRDPAQEAINAQSRDDSATTQARNTAESSGISLQEQRDTSQSNVDNILATNKASTEKANALTTPNKSGVTPIQQLLNNELALSNNETNFSTQTLGNRVKQVEYAANIAGVNSEIATKTKENVIKGTQLDLELKELSNGATWADTYANAMTTGNPILYQQLLNNDEFMADLSATEGGVEGFRAAFEASQSYAMDLLANGRNLATQQLNADLQTLGLQQFQNREDAYNYVASAIDGSYGSVFEWLKAGGANQRGYQLLSDVFGTDANPAIISAYNRQKFNDNLAEKDKIMGILTTPETLANMTFEDQDRVLDLFNTRLSETVGGEFARFATDMLSATADGVRLSNAEGSARADREAWLDLQKHTADVAKQQFEAAKYQQDRLDLVNGTDGERYTFFQGVTPNTYVTNRDRQLREQSEALLERRQRALDGTEVFQTTQDEAKWERELARNKAERAMLTQDPESYFNAQQLISNQQNGGNTMSDFAEVWVAAQLTVRQDPEAFNSGSNGVVRPTSEEVGRSIGTWQPYSTSQKVANFLGFESDGRGANFISDPLGTLGFEELKPNDAQIELFKGFFNFKSIEQNNDESPSDANDQPIPTTYDPTKAVPRTQPALNYFTGLLPSGGGEGN